MIKRRDLLHGAATVPALGLASLTAGAAQRQRTVAYPPAKTGLRGSHDGSFEVAHALAREGQTDFGPAIDDSDQYDLVVVGAGISGLAAAYFYRQQKPAARILIMDNHDDFGGHAKRNEFTVDGKSIIGYGGSQTLESPSKYSDVAKRLLGDLSVDLDGFEAAYDRDFYVKHGLRGGLFLDRETYGQSAFVDVGLISTSDFLNLAPPRNSTPEAVTQMPISDADKKTLLGLLQGSGDAVEDVGLTDLPEYLGSISYLQFVRERLGVTSPVVENLLHCLPSSYFGAGIDCITALEAMAMGLPGAQQLGVLGVNWIRKLLVGLGEPYIHHFPDGNASIARLLVRSLIPDLAVTTNPSDLLTTGFDYSKLDRAENQTRIRLNSTAVHVRQARPGVEVHYVAHGQMHKVQSKHCVLACYNMIIPYLCPDLPAPQKAALSELVKIPLVYTNVALRNWRALKALGIGQVHAPNMFHQLMMVDFPVSMGGYHFAKTPDEPILLHMSSAFGASGLPPKQQFRVGRAKLLSTPYEAIEADLKNHLDQLLGPGGFQSDRDIAAITVNRWPHGYAYGRFPLFDPTYEAANAPHEIGRQTWGPIAIANSDAGARAYLDEAIDQAHRAVSELI